MHKSRIRRLEERIEVLEERVNDLEKTPIPRQVRIEVSSGGSSVGGNIRARRQALGMTQENLANALGLGRSMIAQIERGSKIPNLMLGRDIARVLQCDLEELVKE